MIESAMQETFLGWTAVQWTLMAASAVGGTLALMGLRRVLVRRLGRLAGRTKTRVDDVVVEILESLSPFFLAVISALVAVQVLDLRIPSASRIALLASMLQFGLTGSRLIGASGRWYAEAGPEEPSRVTAARAVELLGRLALWSVVVVLALDNFGVDITALVTGLGIGGVAVALAVQNVLKDLLAYISIMVDKPFIVGDFLIVGEFLGTVEAVGIKSTRIRSLSGEQVIFANEDLLQSRIRNYKRMYERRVLFTVGVEYGTPASTLQAIPGILRAAIEARESVRFDRAHLRSFDASAVTFEAVYYVLEPDYTLYMDIQQAVNLDIYEAFGREGISFAFPTQTLHVASLPAEQTPG